MHSATSAAAQDCIGQHSYKSHRHSAAVVSRALPGVTRELSGVIWSYLEVSGVIWSYLELSGVIWSYLELSGVTRSYLELSCL